MQLQDLVFKFQFLFGVREVRDIHLCPRWFALSKTELQDIAVHHNVFRKFVPKAGNHATCIDIKAKILKAVAVLVVDLICDKTHLRSRDKVSLQLIRKNKTVKCSCHFQQFQISVLSRNRVGRSCESLEWNPCCARRLSEENWSCIFPLEM